VLGIYRNPLHLFRAEMASLAHLSWVMVPLTLVLGGWALAQFVSRQGRIGPRYAHAGAVLVLWLIWLGAQYYTRTHPGWALGGPSRYLLDVAAFTLTVGSAAGLTLRHTPPERHRTPRVLAVHVLMALGTAVFLVLGLWPYR
jgi:hypothetical protein